MDSRTEKNKDLVVLQGQLQDVQEKIEFTRRKLGELPATTNRTERDAVLVVEKVGPAGGRVRFNYLVDDASWRPQYKLRAGKTAKDPVQPEYLAAVSQHTGEDWPTVELVLSTAQATLNSVPPDLQTLQVAAAAAVAAAPLPALTPDEMSRIKVAVAKLTPEDRALTEAQVFCAIDQETALGSNGPPIKMMVKGQPVFVCCKGCKAEVTAHPDEALAQLAALRARLKVPPQR